MFGRQWVNFTLFLKQGQGDGGRYKGKDKLLRVYDILYTPYDKAMVGNVLLAVCQLMFLVRLAFLVFFWVLMICMGLLSILPHVRVSRSDILRPV